MAKADLHLIRALKKGDTGTDVVAVKRMVARVPGSGYSKQVKRHGKFNPHFGGKLDAAIRRIQRKHLGKGADDGVVGYKTFKVLVHYADSYDSKLLTEYVTKHVGDWGIWGRHSAWAGIDMGVDHLGKGHIPMPDDGEIVRVVHSGSGWPGIGGLIVVQCDHGPMAKHPIYVGEDIVIPRGNVVGKRLSQFDLLADATGTNQAPGIESGWSGSKANGYHGTLFQELHGHYTEHPRATAEGMDFWATLSAWMARPR